MVRPLLASLVACTSPDSAAPTRAVQGIELTWLGVTTWLLRTPHQTFLLDAYLTRGAPGAVASGPEAAALLDLVMRAEEIDGIDHILVGHSHFDHAWDAGTAARQTGATVWGSATTCHIAAAQGLAGGRCRVVSDGDILDLGGGTAEVVRTSHWGPDTPSGAHGVWTEPPAGPEEVGLAPHGGVLGFLLELEGNRIFVHDTLGPVDAEDGSGFDYRAGLDRIAAGPPVDLWIGAVSLATDASMLDPYLRALRTPAVLAHHWDGVVPDPRQPLLQSFSAQVFVGDALESAGAALSAPRAYGERLVFDGRDVTTAAHSPVVDALQQ
ncbi:MAG: MBL fold metallo-hydrolase [Myxococcota bacterium]|nr:MBL fold metallo-hydrolase [Myxococcota bacterium]